uniref:Uncharacterized protein n=1 Tax=Arundo donax TaxID=35708 RepID=A0A0A9AHE3_ARUDO
MVVPQDEVSCSRKSCFVRCCSHHTLETWLHHMPHESISIKHHLLGHIASKEIFCSVKCIDAIYIWSHKYLSSDGTIQPTLLWCCRLLYFCCVP